MSSNKAANIVRKRLSSKSAQHLDTDRALSQCLYDTGYLKAILPEMKIEKNAAIPEDKRTNRGNMGPGRTFAPLCPNRKDTGVKAGN